MSPTHQGNQHILSIFLPSGFSLLLRIHAYSIFSFYFTPLFLFLTPTCLPVSTAALVGNCNACPFSPLRGFSYLFISFFLLLLRLHPPMYFHSSSLYFPSSYRPVCPSRLRRSLGTALPYHIFSIYFALFPLPLQPTCLPVSTGHSLVTTVPVSFVFPFHFFLIQLRLHAYHIF